MSDRELTPEEIAAQVAKDKAEAEQSVAEADRIRAEVEKTKAETEEAKAKASVASCMAEKARFDLEVSKEKHQRYLSSDERDKVYRFLSPVNSQSVKDCIDSLTYWHRTDPECNITMVLSSPGGEVMSGMALYDFMKYLSSKGHHITTICSGYAASMAGIILQAGDTRVCGKESYILIHEVSAGAIGKIGEMEDEVNFVKKICERVMGIFIDRSGGKLTKRVLKKNWTRKDWWLASDEALRLGVVDEIR